MMAKGPGSCDEEVRQHVAQCSTCQRLIQDFSEALEDQKALSLRDSGRQAVLKPVFKRLGAMAAAACLAIAVGLTAYLVLRPGRPAPSALLASADVVSASEAESTMATRGQKSFASGEQIIFRIEVSRPCFLTLLGISPDGQIRTVRRSKDSPQNATFSASPGTIEAGPYELDATPGEEVLIIVATSREIPDLEAKVAEAQAGYRSPDSLPAVLELIRRWPAEVGILKFQHDPPVAE